MRVHRSSVLAASRGNSTRFFFALLICTCVFGGGSPIAALRSDVRAAARAARAELGEGPCGWCAALTEPVLVAASDLAADNSVLERVELLLNATVPVIVRGSTSVSDARQQWTAALLGLADRAACDAARELGQTGTGAQSDCDAMGGGGITGAPAGLRSLRSQFGREVLAASECHADVASATGWGHLAAVSEKWAQSSIDDRDKMNPFAGFPSLDLHGAYSALAEVSDGAAAAQREAATSLSSSLHAVEAMVAASVPKHLQETAMRRLHGGEGSRQNRRRRERRSHSARKTQQSDGFDSPAEFFDFAAFGPPGPLSERDSWYVSFDVVSENITRWLQDALVRPPEVIERLSFATERGRGSSWVFVGTHSADAGRDEVLPGTARHRDATGVWASFHSQVVGSKRWKLEPPPECAAECNELEFDVEDGDLFAFSADEWWHSTALPEQRMRRAPLDGCSTEDTHPQWPTLSFDVSVGLWLPGSDRVEDSPAAVAANADPAELLRQFREERHAMGRGTRNAGSGSLQEFADWVAAKYAEGHDGRDGA